MINLSDYHLDFLNCPSVSFSDCLCVSFSVRVSFSPRISAVRPFGVLSRELAAVLVSKRRRTVAAVMKSFLALALAVLVAYNIAIVRAGDADPLQDFCVADKTSKGM
jgi:hypothetical protein